MKKFGLMTLIFTTCFIFCLLFYSARNGNQMAFFSDQQRKINIKLNGTSISSDSSSKVKIDGQVLTIAEQGTYCISGELTDGQIIVDTDKDSDVIIHLDGVNITCLTSSPIYIKQAKNVTLKLKGSKENIFTDGSSYEKTSLYEEVPTACIYSECDLKIKSEKSPLIVHGNFKDGIVSKKDLKIYGGRTTVDAMRNGIYGKDTLTVKAGKTDITCDRDGLRSRGIVTIIDEEAAITAKRYGIYAFNAVNITESSKLSITGANSEIGCIGQINQSYVPATDETSGQ